MSNLPAPESRDEQYLQFLANGTGALPEKPESRIEEYLAYLCRNGGLGKFEVILVDTSVYPTLESFLASVGEERKIYLYPDTTAQSPNLHKEFLWIEAAQEYEQIGDTNIDLSQYYRKTETDALIDAVVENYETWTFVLDDGTSVTKKVVLSDA